MIVLSEIGRGPVAHATPDLRFDVATFCCPCSVEDHLCQPQFDALNWSSLNGHYVAMGGDAHRLELATNGNVLAIYYNALNDDYPASTGVQKAGIINQYAMDGFTTTGPRPDWIILNEISFSLWPGEPAYRAWVHDVVHTLKNTYGYQVILFSPFPNPAANSADWQAVAEDACIAIENYLSGGEIEAQSFSVSWCQSKYQSSINSYAGLNVARSKLMLGEHFGQTLTGTAWGRGGVSSNQWDSAINVRSQAARNVGFPGFLSFAWGKNGMMVADEELIHFEGTYSNQALPTNGTLTRPFIVVQPSSQGVPRGADAAFIVFPAGNAPMSYQWQFNGTNIPGATTSALTIPNVQVGETGVYSVVLSNAAGITVSSNASLTIGPPPLAYEPFGYAAGASLAGQTNAEGQAWTQAGPNSANQPVVEAGNLNATGLAGPGGHSVRFGGNGTSARFNIGTSATGGSWFFSFLLRVADITGLSPTGVFWAGFNNSTGTQTTTPTVVGTRIVTRAADGGFNIGLDKSSGSVGNFVFHPEVFTTADTIFLVGSYSFHTGVANDDVSQLWINPAPSTFGLVDAPPATLISGAGSDLSQLASFVLFNRNATEPALIYADELRIGTSWASVTPPAANGAVPVLTISLSTNSAVLSWTTNAPGFALEVAPTPAWSEAWMGVMGPVYIIAGSYTVTNAVSSGQTFYRLRRP